MRETRHARAKPTMENWRLSKIEDELRQITDTLDQPENVEFLKPNSCTDNKKNNTYVSDNIKTSGGTDSTASLNKYQGLRYLTEKYDSLGNVYGPAPGSNCSADRTFVDSNSTIDGGIEAPQLLSACVDQCLQNGDGGFQQTVRRVGKQQHSQTNDVTSSQGSSRRAVDRRTIAMSLGGTMLSADVDKAINNQYSLSVVQRHGPHDVYTRAHRACQEETPTNRPDRRRGSDLCDNTLLERNSQCVSSDMQHVDTVLQGQSCRARRGSNTDTSKQVESYQRKGEDDMKRLPIKPEYIGMKNQSNGCCGHIEPASPGLRTSVDCELIADSENDVFLPETSCGGKNVSARDSIWQRLVNEHTGVAESGAQCSLVNNDIGKRSLSAQKSTTISENCAGKSGDTVSEGGCESNRLASSPRNATSHVSKRLTKDDIQNVNLVSVPMRPYAVVHLPPLSPGAATLVRNQRRTNSSDFAEALAGKKEDACANSPHTQMHVRTNSRSGSEECSQPCMKLSTFRPPCAGENNESKISLPREKTSRVYMNGVHPDTTRKLCVVGVPTNGTNKKLATFDCTQSMQKSANVTLSQPGQKSCSTSTLSVPGSPSKNTCSTACNTDYGNNAVSEITYKLQPKYDSSTFRSPSGSNALLSVQSEADALSWYDTSDSTKTESNKSNSSRPTPPIVGLSGNGSTSSLSRLSQSCMSLEPWSSKPCILVKPLVPDDEHEALSASSNICSSKNSTGRTSLSLPQVQLVNATGFKSRTITVQMPRGNPDAVLQPSPPSVALPVDISRNVRPTSSDTKLVAVINNTPSSDGTARRTSTLKPPVRQKPKACASPISPTKNSTQLLSSSSSATEKNVKDCQSNCVTSATETENLNDRRTIHPNVASNSTELHNSTLNLTRFESSSNHVDANKTNAAKSDLTSSDVQFASSNDVKSMHIVDNVDQARNCVAVANTQHMQAESPHHTTPVPSVKDAAFIVADTKPSTGKETTTACNKNGLEIEGVRYTNAALEDFDGVKTKHTTLVSNGHAVEVSRISHPSLVAGKVEAVDCSSARRTLFHNAVAEDELHQVEIFYRSHKTDVFVCRCTANLYYGISRRHSSSVTRKTPQQHLPPESPSSSSRRSDSRGSWTYITSGIPVLVLDSGEARRQRKLHVILAERGSGFALWKDDVDHLTCYSVAAPSFHTMHLSNDHTRLAGLSFYDTSAAHEFFQRIETLISNPDDCLLNLSSGATPRSSSKHRRGLSPGRSGRSKRSPPPLRKLPSKTDISAPICFRHVTKLNQVDGLNVLRSDVLMRSSAACVSIITDRLAVTPRSVRNRKSSAT